MRFARNLYTPPASRTPRGIQVLFWDPRVAWLWLLVRLYVGYEWLDAGYHKIRDDAWMSTGTALQGFWKSSTAIPQTGSPRITYDWYRDFLTYMLDNEWYTWFAKLIAVGEFAIGIALIIGAFVGVAAFFGAFMNFNFMLAGSSSTNPVLFFMAIGLLLAWRIGGYFGVDRVLLPAIGTPWEPGRILGRGGGQRQPAAQHR